VVCLGEDAFLVWFFTFLLALSIVLALLLHEHEVQMILMRIYAAGWSFMEFNPRKIINLTLPSGEVIPAPISMVASHPDVAIAWNKLMRAIWGSLFISLFVAVPLAGLVRRLLEAARQVDPRRASPARRDAGRWRRARRRHQCPQPGCARTGNRRAAARHELDEVIAMPLAERKAAGIHHAYSIAGVPFPWRTEQAHTMMIGSTGTGKTTQMRALIAQMRVRRDRAVVFDLTGAYVEAFYNPETDT
jgi:hypothetical protein